MAETKITQTEVNPAYRQSGWGYVTFNGSTNSANVSITFPTAFAAAPKVILGALGFKISTAPTAASDFTGVYGGGGASYGGFTWIAEA